ncbi:uncharacterized protein [Henckelia pumila]|uniref:uncharacterized protein isoform X2 n=1 Tax=Henckelia pumila TaxID=405737 RepID=UPI003C6DD020
MTGSTSSSNRTCHGGSNALSHVYIQCPPLRCQLPGSRSVFYDDGNKLLLALTSDRVFSWKTTPYNPSVPPSSDPISEGSVLSIRYSLDLKLFAVQRSSHEIEIWNRETGKAFSQGCRSDSEKILGFFWTDCAVCDIVFVKTSGLDLYSYNAESQSLYLVETKKQSVSWYIYTHESRLVLLASGMQCKTFTGYQLSSAGTIRLPRFEMALTKSEMNSKPILVAEDVHIFTVYGRIYCLQFDRVAMLLHLHRFYRDAVVQQGSLPVYSNRISVSVVDNILIIHQVDAKSSGETSGSSESNDPSEVTVYGENWNFLVPDLVCDVSSGCLWKIHLDLEAISASCSDAPFMLEFLQRRKLEASKAKELCLAIARTIILERRPVPMVAKALDIFLMAYTHALKTGTYNKRTKAEETSSSGVSNINIPPVVVDKSSGLDASGKFIRNVSETGVEHESYKSSFSASDSDGAASSSSNQMKSHIMDSSTGKPEIGYIMECKASGMIASSPAPTGQVLVLEPGNVHFKNNNSELLESDSTSAIISPADVHHLVFAPIEEEMVGDGSYMVAVVVEFIRSVSLEKLKVQPNTYVLMVQILNRDDNYAELGMLVMNKIIEPSREVALQLLESGSQNFQIRKLGMAMLRQLSFHHDYAMLLVQDGYYLEALRFARKNKVNTVRPSLFLEAACAANDPQHLAAVLRFLSDFIPGFKSTSDHLMYRRVVADMSPSVAT